MDGKKPSLAIAIGLPKRGDEEQPDGDEPSSDDMKEARLEAARAILEAVKSGDAAALDEALKTHADACMGEPDGDDE
jgi:DNA-binding GntR family transcriptional regulator